MIPCGLRPLSMGTLSRATGTLSRATTAPAPVTTTPESSGGVPKTVKIVGLAGLVVLAAVGSFYLPWKVGQAFAPTEKQKEKYGWIGIGVAMFGIPAFYAVLRAITGGTEG